MQGSQAYFLIADISGYTRFVAQTEIDHATGVLEELFGAVVSAFQAPLTVSGLQGDAVFAYAIDSDIVSRQFVLDFAERIYCIFAETRERMRINTTCPCAACAKIGDLDLKIIVHHGEYVVQETAGRSELAGRDVIAAFRLLKNDVADKTGISAYALITRDAVRHMELDAFFQPVQWMTQTYEHIGKIEFVVHELASAWRKKRDAERIFVAAADDLLIPEEIVTLPVSPASAFTLVTRPDMRRHWISADRIDVEDDDRGRIDKGVVYHCHHGKQTFIYEIVDWRPGEYVTGCFRLPLALRLLCTEELVAVGEGTIAKIRFSRVTGGNLAGRLLRPFLQFMLKKNVSADVPRNAARLKEQAETLLTDTPQTAPNRAADTQAVGLMEAVGRKLAASPPSN